MEQMLIIPEHRDFTRILPDPNSFTMARVKVITTHTIFTISTARARIKTLLQGGVAESGCPNHRQWRIRMLQKGFNRILAATRHGCIEDLTLGFAEYQQNNVRGIKQGG